MSPPDTVPTFVTAERFDRAAKRGCAYEARVARTDLAWGLVELVDALNRLADAGADKDRLNEMARIAHDAISIRDAACRKDMDEGGMGVEPMVLTELDDLIERMS